MRQHRRQPLQDLAHGKRVVGPRLSGRHLFRDVALTCTPRTLAQLVDG